MTICFFGNYIRDYPRIQVLKKGLIMNGIDIVECHTRTTGVRKFLDLYRQHRKLRGRYNVLLVGMGGYALVGFAKLLTRKPVVFDAFVSLYLTNVEDRQICKPGSLKSIYYAWLDKISCQLSDMVLLDTYAQIDYFVARYNLDKKKFTRVLVGADDAVYYPNPAVKKNGKFLIHWHGYIVPFYSLETVVETARLLKDYQDIEFRFISRLNSKYEKIKALAHSYGLSNVDFRTETDLKGLALSINECDIALGIFGDNSKAKVVIPNKIYEAIACRRAVITANHKVLDELFTDGRDILTVRANDPRDLADKILLLKSDIERRDAIANNAYVLYKSTSTPYKLVQPLISSLLKNFTFISL